jgi:hypothetical protein
MQGSTTLSVNKHQPEGLRSIGITRFRCCAGGNSCCAGGNKRYYALIRLPKRPHRSDAFPRQVGRNRIKPLTCQRLLPPICPPHGTSQVSDFTFDARCSQPPRIARWLHLPVASPSMIDFALFGGLVAIKLRNEAESPCLQKHGLALRLASLPGRIPPPPIAQRKRHRTTRQTGNLHDNLLTGYELNQTYLAIPKIAEKSQCF